MKTWTYRANGKLLLSAEYLILEGATGLAIPTSFGQTMEVMPDDSGALHWKSFSDGLEWFSAKFNSDNTEILETSDKSKATFLQKILKQAEYQSGKPFSFSGKISTELEFPVNWGLGSSSTLISLVAQWSDVNAFRLGEKTQGGSLYDIACARAKSPIIYQKMGDRIFMEEISFYPRFHSDIFFVHLGTKQNTQNSVQTFKETKSFSPDDIQRMSELTNRISKSESTKEMMGYLDFHEDIISGIIGEQKVKDRLFPDFEGSLKSLGAWGGDFAMAVHPKQDYTLKFFQQKGFNTIVPFKKMILGNGSK